MIGNNRKIVQFGRGASFSGDTRGSGAAQAQTRLLLCITRLMPMFIATPTVLIPTCLVALTFSSPYVGVISISNKAYLLIQ